MVTYWSFHQFRREFRVPEAEASSAYHTYVTFKVSLRRDGGLSIHWHGQWVPLGGAFFGKEHMPIHKELDGIPIVVD